MHVCYCAALQSPTRDCRGGRPFIVSQVITLHLRMQDLLLQRRLFLLVLLLLLLLLVRELPVLLLLGRVLVRRATTGACEEQLRRAPAGDKRSLRSSLLFCHRVTPPASKSRRMDTLFRSRGVNRTATTIRAKHVLHDLKWSRILSWPPILWYQPPSRPLGS